MRIAMEDNMNKDIMARFGAEKIIGKMIQTQTRKTH